MPPTLSLARCVFIALAGTPLIKQNIIGKYRFIVGGTKINDVATDDEGVAAYRFVHCPGRSGIILRDDFVNRVWRNLDGGIPVASTTGIYLLSWNPVM